MFFPSICAGKPGPLARFSALLALLSVTWAASAQINVNLCTEENLRTSLAGGGHIVLDCGTNVITLTRPIIISQNTTISSSSTNLEVVLSGANQTRLFVVEQGATLRLERVALFSGRQTETNVNHGGIPDTAGAGIYNDGGHVEVFGSRFQSHSVLGITGAPGASGGDGRRGEDGGDAAGAAIFNNGGSVLVSNSVFQANSVTGGPGGNGGDGRNDTGDGGNGGSAGGAAIYSQGGTVQIYNTTFTNNTSAGALAGVAGAATGVLSFPGDPGQAGDAVGAAVAGSGATITIYGSTFVSNQATAADGANGTDGLRNLNGHDARAGGAAAGGAVYLIGGPLSITNSTFFANSAVSGDGGTGGAGGPASFGFDGGRGGNGGLASGGAVEAAGGGVIVHSTFSDNALTAGLGGAGGEGGGTLGRDGDSGNEGLTLGAALHAPTVALRVANTILAISASETLAGSIVDEGGNLSSGASLLLNSGKSYVNRNAMLRALADNGGPTPTMAIATNSPAATNLSVLRFCVPLDQRGSNRVDGCDIGAFELITPPVVVPTNMTIAATLSSNNVVLQFPGTVTNVFVETSSTVPSTNWTRITDPVQLTTNGSTISSRVEMPLLPDVPSKYFRLNSTNAVGGSTSIILPPIPGGPPAPGSDSDNPTGPVVPESPEDPAPPGFPDFPPLPGGS